MKPGTPGFIGGRLRAAREARAISAVSLADLIGVTRAAVSQYEHGKQTPSPQVLRTIADRLNLPVHHFLAPTATPGSATVFYRSFSSATKLARLRAQRRYEWFRSAAGLLRRFVKFPEYKLPALNLAAKWEDISPQNLEDASNQIRQALGVTVQPLPNVVLLLERAGVVVGRHVFDSGALDAFSSSPMGEPNPFVILGADKGSAVRSRFDAAHELAHIVLHRDVSERDLRDRDSLKTIEGQADRFASALLLPKEEFSDDARSVTLDRLLVLKSKWGVSVGAMIMRCSQLNLIDEEKARKLWINYARRGWKRREPYDELIRLEEPRFIRRSFEMVLERGVLSREQLLHYLALYPRDVEEVVGLRNGLLSSTVDPEADIISWEQKLIPFPS